MLYTDPSGEFIFTVLAAVIFPPALPFAIAADASWMASYAGQVMGNYQEGLFGSEAWFGKIDYFDLVIAAGIGGLTGGYGATPIVTSTFGKSAIIIGGSLLQGAVDFTGKGEFRSIGVNKPINEVLLDATQSLVSNYSQNKFMSQFSKASVAATGSLRYFLGGIDVMFGAVNNTVTEYGRNDYYNYNKELFPNNKKLFPFDENPNPFPNTGPKKRNDYEW